MKRASTFGAIAALVAAAIASCQPNYTQHSCLDVPEAGCPLSNGEACADPTCAAAYACNADGTWTLDHTCDGYDGAVAPIPDAGDAAPTDTHDANIDAPPGAFGGPGCDLLAAPDCELGFAIDCPAGCCGCEDLFVCQSGGWVPWGSCSEDAGLVIKPESRRP